MTEFEIEEVGDNMRRRLNETLAYLNVVEDMVYDDEKAGIDRVVVVVEKVEFLGARICLPCCKGVKELCEGHDIYTSF